MINMEYTREAVTAQLIAAQAEVDRAEVSRHAADALDQVTSRSGLRYAPLSPDQRSYVVACNGEVIGQLWRGEEGHVLGGWTAARLGGTDRLGPFHTARAAAAALAKASGICPDNTLRVLSD